MGIILNHASPETTQSITLRGTTNIVTCMVRVLSLALFVVVAASFNYGQTPPARSSSPAKSTTADKNKAAQEEAKRLEEQRRSTAISLLISVADEARSYRDQTLRARILARSADILWETDVEKARMLFRRAWEAADVADAESQRRFEEERRAQEEADQPFSGVSPTSLRTEILRMVARRDRKLGEELLAKLDEARKQAAANASTQKDNSSAETHPFELSEGLKLRLKAAQQLLNTDVVLAIQVADPALTRVSIDGLAFLCFLRAKNPAAADERFASMLAIAGADAESDANTVSLLSSYVFTPFLFITVAQDGGMNSSQFSIATPAADVSPELRATFFRIAEQIFLLPLPPREQDHSTSGLLGKYRVMERVLPYFQQYASPQATTLMKAQLTALSREVPEIYKRRDEATETRDADSEDAGMDSIESILKRIERAESQDERDNLYAQIALIASGNGDPRAFEFADKIESSDTRKSVRAYVDFNALRTAILKKRFEDALKLARSGGLTNIQRVWALTQIAYSFVKTDRDKAIDLLEEAAIEARRIGGSSADRSRALVGVATMLYEASHGPVWEIMSEVIRAANNSTEEFSGDDARVVSSMRTKTQSTMIFFTVEEFNLHGIFRLLAKEDLQRAILLAKDFNGESPRATALIAIVRSVLDPKPVAGPRKSKA